MPEPALTPEAESRVAGWYGKIPALGDFASRRLPPQFVDAWDTWLQGAIASSRSTLRERWQDFYLCSPIWRFVLLPGTCGDTGWIGIMMPSVDKVGRHFPLTIAVAVDSNPTLLSTVFSTESWFAAVEEVALSTLSLDFQVTDLEERLMATPFGNLQESGSRCQTAAGELAEWWNQPKHSPFTARLSEPDSVFALMSVGGVTLMSSTGSGRSLWWVRPDENGDLQLHGFWGLPPVDYFTVLLAGTTDHELQAATQSMDGREGQ